MCILIDSGMFNEGEGLDAILRINMVIFVDKAYQIHIIIPVLILNTCLEGIFKTKQQ